jgi:hypothetical protein
MAVPTPPPNGLLSFLYNVSYDPDLGRLFRSDPGDFLKKNFNLTTEVQKVLTALGNQCSLKPLDLNDPVMKNLFNQLMSFLGNELATDRSPTFW